MTRRVAGVVFCLIAGCLNLSAQTRTTSAEAWEVEFHVGGAFISTPEDGDGSVPGGTRLTNVGPQMWQVPSWYFGDGASLLTQFPLPRTTPLDSVLLGVIARRERSATYGAGVARKLAGRLRVEGNIDFSSGAREATASTRTALEASRASFVEYWRGFPTIASATVTSSIEVHEGDLREVLTTGAVSWDLTPIGRVVPYVVGGGGVRWSTGDGPAASIVGSYSTLVLNIRETDSLNIRYVRSSRTAVGVFGGGVRWPVGQRWGIRVDIREPCFRVGCLHRTGCDPGVGAKLQRVDHRDQSWLDDGHPIRELSGGTTHVEWSRGTRRPDIPSRRSGASREGDRWCDLALLTSVASISASSRRQ